MHPATPNRHKLKIDYTSYVNPFIGTDFTGNTYPGAQAPFGMVQLSPDNGLPGWDRISGYFYPDSTIAGFSHTHLSGTGAGDLYDISFMPVTLPLQRGSLALCHIFANYQLRQSLILIVLIYKKLRLHADNLTACLQNALCQLSHQTCLGTAINQRITARTNPGAQLFNCRLKFRIIACRRGRYTVIFMLRPPSIV